MPKKTVLTTVAILIAMLAPLPAAAPPGNDLRLILLVALVLMRARIKPGEYSAAAALNDLAPTLATIAGVDIPSGSSGRVLTEALRRPAGATTTESSSSAGSRR